MNTSDDLRNDVKDPIKMYRRLFSLAFKRFSCDRDASHDVATLALSEMLAEGTDDFNYGYTVLKHRVLTDRRNAARRKTYQLPVNEDGEEVELKVAACIASQDETMMARECLIAIENLPDKTRDVMRLVAREFTTDEVVEELGLPKSEVYWRTRLGRKLLRERAGYELERKRGHHKYIGIRKECRRWNASIKQGEEYYWLGTFATAAEAAKAYDEKARVLYGLAATLNFPEKSATATDCPTEA